MNSELAASGNRFPPPACEAKGWRRVARESENAVVWLALAAMMVLPLAEIVLRKVFRTGISGSSSLVQHLTLIVGMVGGALAARENRLLSLSTAATYFKGWLKTSALIFSSGFAAAISVFLCGASIGFVLTSKSLGKILAYDIPVWVMQLVL